MRYFLIFLVWSFSNVPVLAQNHKNPFSSFDKQPHVQSTSVNKRMFQMMANVKTDPSDKDNVAYQNFIKDLDHLQTYSTKSKISELSEVAENYRKETQMILLDSKNKSNRVFQYFGNKEATKSSVNELLLLIEDQQNSTFIIVHLFGNFSLDEFDKLSRKLKLATENSN